MERQPTPVFLPGEFHGQRGLAGYSPWGRKESDMTEQLKTKKVKVPAFSVPVFSSLSRAYEAAALVK